MNKKGKLILSTVIIVLVGLGIFFTQQSQQKPKSRKDNGLPVLNFEEGDYLEEVDVYSYTSELVDISELKGENKLFIFAWDKCGDCISEYDTYKIINALYHDNDLSIYYIWDDNIPEKTISELGINLQQCYSANGKVKITNWVPTYMIVDDNSKILLHTDDTQALVDYLQVNNQIKESGLASLLKGPVNLIGIDRCSSCQNAFEELQNEEVEFTYIISGEITSDREMSDNIINDKYGIIAKIFNFEVFPQKIKVGNNGSILFENES